MAVLTENKESFCHFYIQSGNASEAYRQATGSQGKAEGIHVNAHRYLKDANVQLRIQELRDELEIARRWSRIKSVNVLAEIAEYKPEPIKLDDEGEPIEGQESLPVKASDQVNAVKALNTMYGWDKTIIEQTTTHRVEESLAERLTGGSKR